MLPGLRQLRIALKTFALQRAGNLPSNPTQIHPHQVRTFGATSPLQESPNVKNTPLFQQLAANQAALLALKDFGQNMKDLGIEFSADRPPSTMQLFKLMANSEFRTKVQKLRDDLEKAGVDVSPENAMEMLEAFKQSESKSK